MRRFSQLLNEDVANDTPKTNNVYCIYGGKFQPFHAGHFEIYERLVKRFGKDNVYICTADIPKKGYDDKHIFSFDEKADIMNTMFGIDKRHIVRIKGAAPFLPSWRELPFNGSDYALVTVVGRKDAERFEMSSRPDMEFLPYTDERPLKSTLVAKYYLIEDNKRVRLSATDVRTFFRSGADTDTKKKRFKEFFGGYNERIFELVDKRINNIFESAVFESGMQGHVRHLDSDLTLTMHDIFEIIDAGFSNNLKSGVEKVDGQPLVMSYKDGEYLFGYHEMLRPLDELIDKELFKDLSKRVFRNTAQRMMDAIDELGNPNNIFDNGRRVLHMEILSKEMTNMVPYYRNAIVLHYLVDVDVNGKPVNYDRDAAIRLSEELRGDGDVVILGPPMLKVRDIDYSSVMNRLKGDGLRIVKDAGCSVDDTLLDIIAGALRKRTMDSGIELTDRNIRLLTKKLIGTNKTHEISTRNYGTQENVDKINANYSELQKIVEDEYDDIKVFITRISVEILKNMESLVCIDPREGHKSMVRAINQGIKDIEEEGRLSEFERALRRVEKLGIENIVPSEGLLFFYKGKVYKITGIFADYIKLAQTVRGKIKKAEFTL